MSPVSVQCGDVQATTWKADFYDFSSADGLADGAAAKPVATIGTMPEFHSPGPTPGVLHINNLRAIKFLIDTDELRFLKPFIQHERTLAVVARELNADLSVLTHKVKRPVSMGLLEVTRTVARSGRSFNHYRSTADESFIPKNAKAIEWIISQSEASFNRRVEHSLLYVWLGRVDQTASGWGLRIVQADDFMQIIPALNQHESWESMKSATPATHHAHGLRISEQDAAWFCEQAQRLIAELIQRHAPDQNSYVVRLALVPEAID